MACWDIGLRHIIDVDGQLLAIDAEVVDTASLLAKAHKGPDLDLYVVRAGERRRLEERQLIRLSHDEVLFFETSEANLHVLPERLAA